MAKEAERSPGNQNARGASMLGSVRDKLGLLNKPLKLERSDGRVRVVFEPAPATVRTPADDAADAAVQRMRSELKELLGRCPGAREVLPHLAGVEHALKTQGLSAFDTLPPRILQRACAQLESVLAEPASAGLAELRSRIGVALMAHEEREQAAARRAAPSSFLVDEKLQVSESSVSDFMRVLEATQRDS
jgi:hypothetical protein